MSVAREVVPMMTSRRRGADTAAGPQRPGRVLLVEDEHDVAELIRYNLAKEGYDVVLATNGTDALRLAREVRPDVVLLDIMVSQLKGWEVCRRLKQDPDLSGPVRPAPAARTASSRSRRRRARIREPCPLPRPAPDRKSVV